MNETIVEEYSIDDNVENNKEKDIKLITDFFKKIYRKSRSRFSKKII